MATPATNKQSVAFRFNPITVARLKQRAQETHAPQTALAERYIEEGLRHDEHPLIYFRDGAMGRRPALFGTRLDVAQVVTTVRQNGNSVVEAADYLRGSGRAHRGVHSVLRGLQGRDRRLDRAFQRERRTRA